jgi:HD-GYP domain-containing protein (c-di-GMP phosphodiesterase class II)
MTSRKADSPKLGPIGEIEEKLLTSFFVLYKTARLVDAENEGFKNQLENFMRRFKEIAAGHQAVVIKAVGGHYFVNEDMVRFDDKGLSGASTVVAEWRKLGIGGVRFDIEIPSREVSKFFKLMAEIKPDDHNLESLAAELATLSVSQVQLLSLRSLEDDKPRLSEEVRRQFRKRARKTFFKAMSQVQEVMVSASQDHEINIARTRRVVHSLIDQITRDEQSMIELASIRDYDEYTFAHSTNVAVYALTLGVRLRLDRARLSELGFAALFHDMGKVKLPQDLIRKPDAFDEDDWIQMQRHPLLGAKTVLRNLKLDVHTVRAARVAFEHHINADFTGYPLLHYARRPANLFSQIVSIADSFDALTSGRVYLRRRLQPDQVLKKMSFQMKTKFDPFLLKLFNNIIGIYPAGTLVLLTTDELALVLTNNPEDMSRPYVKIVGDREGLLESPLWVDLSMPEHADRKIVRRIDPERYGLRTQDFVLED